MDREHQLPYPALESRVGVGGWGTDVLTSNTYSGFRTKGLKTLVSSFKTVRLRDRQVHMMEGSREGQSPGEKEF